MTCPTSYFSLNFLQKFEFESKSRNSHHDLSDLIFFPKFLKILNLNQKVGNRISYLESEFNNDILRSLFRILKSMPS